MAACQRWLRASQTDSFYTCQLCKIWIMYNLPLPSYKIPMAYKDGTCVTDFKPSYSVCVSLHMVKYPLISYVAEWISCLIFVRHTHLKFWLLDLKMVLPSTMQMLTCNCLTFMTYKPRQERQTDITQCIINPPSGRVLKQKNAVYFMLSAVWCYWTK